MGFEPNEPEQSHCLGAALKAADIKPGELWLRYFSIGGSIGENEVEASAGPAVPPRIERDLLAIAANELIEETPQIHAPYAHELPTAAKLGRPPEFSGRGGPETLRPGAEPGSPGRTGPNKRSGKIPSA